MTNAELIRKIRNEIERRIKECEATYPKDKGGYWFPEQEEAYAIAEEYKHLLSFLSTLESEKPTNQKGLDVTDFCKPIDPGIAQCIADHSWEMLGEDEKPVPKDLEEAAENIYKTPFGTRAEDFKAGAEWQEEQMLKGAVEGEVMLNPYPIICLDDCKDYDFKDGDKVKLIIVKEEDNGKSD